MILDLPACLQQVDRIYFGAQDFAHSALVISPLRGFILFYKYVTPNGV